MDGLSAGVAAIAALFLCLIAATNGQFLVATLAIALCGCSLGFLRSNFHPAKIYMGDAGALFLGFLFAVLSLQLDFPDAPKELAFAVPILVMGVALFDTTLIFVNRILHGRNPMMGGRDHTSHRLVFLGISVPASVGLIYLGAASLGWLGLVVSVSSRGAGLLLVGWSAIVAVLLGVSLSRVPVYETSKGRRLMILEVGDHEPPPAPSEHAAVEPSAPRSAHRRQPLRSDKRS
jgi:UDP-GlcNAc:undecaprenyl-phosphate GlcNAc-1-phosphate transferase